jgi:fructose transport system substrate-binding protein
MNHTKRQQLTRRMVVAGLTAVLAGGTLAACSSGASSNEVGVALIVKTTSNPYFVAMESAAQAEAKKAHVDLTLAAGQNDSDTDTQIQAIEDAISRGDKGILITPNGAAVNNEIEKARKDGLLVIALDTAPIPADTVDITYATDNYAAGQSIGKWAAAQMAGKKAVIAMLDDDPTEVTSVDYDRDAGFLSGMGIAVHSKTQLGTESPTGDYSYSGGKGGYEIVGHQPSQGAADQGRTAMETLLSKDPSINLVYAINEPAAYGAYQALKAAGKQTGVTIVAIDGGCTGVGYVQQGILGATAQQYPSKMAAQGMDAIVAFAKTGKKPLDSAGLNFHDTGSKLITDTPVAGLASITATQGAQTCWKN